MKRHLLIGGLIVALLVAAWFVMAGGGGGRARGEARGAGVVEAPRADKTPEAMSVVESASVPESTEVAPAPVAVREARRSVTEEALARGLWVEGSVVFPPGTPADERVFVEARGKKPEDGEWHEVEVARDGSFRVAFGEGTKTGRLALRGRYLHLDEPARCKAAEPGAITLEPVLGACIEGRVVFPSGETQGKDDQVLLTITDKTGSGSESDQTSRELDAEGRFEFGGVRIADSYQLAFDGARFFGLSSEFRLEPGQLARPELVLERGVVLAGRVTDEAGAPVKGANLNANLDSWESASDHQWAQTEADGSFRMKALRPGKISVQVSAQGFTDLERELGKLAAGEDQELTLVLERGGSISGRLLWPDGTPAVGFVSAEGRNGFSVFGGEGQKTAEDGSFTISGFEGETVTVRARATRTEEVMVKSELTGKERTKKQKSPWNATAEDVAVGTTDLVLTLSASLELVGTVVEEGVGPVDTFRLTAFPVDDGPMDFDFTRQVTKAFKGAGGAFTLTGFTPGKWRLTASSKEHVESEPLELELPTSDAVTLVLRRGARVSGVVVDATGIAVVGATIAVQDRQRREFLMPFDLEEESRSDAEGRFLLPKVEPGPVTLTASAPGFAPSAPIALEVFAGRETSGIVLTLQRGATLTGEIVDLDGRPAAGVDVWIYSSSGTNFHESAESDAVGRFELTGMPAGRTHVQAELENGLELTAQVELAEGASAHVRLAPESKNVVQLVGRVTLDGEPVAGMNLSARRRDEGRSRSSSSTESDAQGEFEMTLSGGGSYSFFLNRWDHESGASCAWSVTLDVPDVREHRHDFAIPLARISGRVTSSAGEPLAGIEVEAEGRADEGELGLRQARCETKADGRYELAVGPGTLTVTAGGGRGRRERSEWAATRLEGLTLVAGQQRSGVDFVLARGGRLTGSVRRSDGSSAGEVWILDATRKDWLGASGDDGTFDFSGLSAGPLTLEVTNGEAVTAQPLTVTIVPGETQTCALTLVTAVQLFVDLPDVPADAEPLATLVDAAGRSRKGRFDERVLAFGSLPPGTYRLSVAHAGKQAERSLELRADEPVLRFPLTLE